MPFWVSSDILLYVRSVYIQLDENCIITVRTFTWTIQVHIASFLFTSSSFFGLYANFTFIYRIQSKTVDNYLIHVFWMLCLPGSSLHGVRISPLRCTIHQIKNIPKFGKSFSSSSFVFVQIYARYPSWERMLVTVSFLVDQLNGHDTPYDQYFYIMFWYFSIKVSFGILMDYVLLILEGLSGKTSWSDCPWSSWCHTTST